MSTNRFHTAARGLRFRPSLLLAAPLLAAVLWTGTGGQASAAAPLSRADASTQPIVVVLDGKKLAVRQSPVIIKGSIMVPMKDILTALGADISWEPKTRTLIASKGNYLTFSLQAGASSGVVNGKSLKLDAPAAVLGGVTFVPVRFVSETMGAEVKWDSAARAVRITSQQALIQAAERQAEIKRQSRRLTTAQIVSLNDDSVVMIETDYGQGSGVVVGDRLILTNLHVMSNGKSGKIVTNDGRTIPIQGVAAYDDKHDLALVLTKENLKLDSIEFGSMDDMEKGDSVVAIGSPLGVQNTVTEGVISNIVYENGTYYYQISAPIDHGSSGGGLFNQYGELIGLTSSGYDDTNAVINYAIPSENAKNLLSTAKFDPAKVEFLKPTLPDSLTGASEADIAKLMKDNFSSVSGSDGDLSLDGWKVERDSAGWLVIKANVNTSFYDYYGSKLQKDIRMWGENTAYELHRMLPKEQIQLSLIYDKTVDFEPRGYAAADVSQQRMAIGTCTTPFWMCSSRTNCCFVCGIRPSFWTVGLLSGGFFCAGSGAWEAGPSFSPRSWVQW